MMTVISLNHGHDDTVVMSVERGDEFYEGGVGWGDTPITLLPATRFWTAAEALARAADLLNPLAVAGR